MRRRTPLALLLVVGCGDPVREGGVFASGLAGETESATGGSGAEAPGGDDPGSSATAGTGVDDGGQSDGGPLLDVAADPGGNTCDPDDPDCGCTAVDILFIVDNSGSMSAHQAALAERFPLFVDVMLATLPVGTSLHVGITTQGGFWTGEGTGSWPLWMCVTDAVPYL